jgi:UDP-N-acetylmuramoyl-L-alanyl-D-glutamate--2,6-diaminopimelate ligase
MSTLPAGLHGVSLRTVLPEAEFYGADDIRIESCSCDSRRCRPGDLFVAVRGSRHDGHDFVSHAARQGAVAVLAQRRERDWPLPACIVPDAAEALGRICQALAGQPSERVKVIGITGTNGKTTTSFLTASVLAAGGHNAGISGTLGCFDGADTHHASHTTPPAPMLANWLARCESNACSHAVMEVSSHALAQHRVSGIQFDIACFTNIRHDHLDYHGSRTSYRQAKARLLDHLSPQGITVVNADDPGSASLLDHVPGPAVTIGIDTAAEITATLVEQTISEQTFLLCSGREVAPVRTPLIGTHNVYNCLIAAAVGFAYGLDLTAIARGLEGISYVPGRLERIECGQPFGVFVDYAHTPDALFGVLSALRSVTRGRLLCVFGAGGDRDRSKRPLMGRAVERAADIAVVTSDNPRSERPLAIIDDILSGFEDRFQPRAIVDRGEAIAWALSQAQADDCVLIAGKGHEDFQQIGDRRLEFDDREQARQWLYRNTPAQPALRAA